MKKFLLFIILLITTLTASAQWGLKPRLVLNITVAGLPYDYLLKYADGMNPDGIKKLTSQGATCYDAKINYLGSTTPAGVATIATGTTPSGHGIMGDHWYDYTTNKEVWACYDEEVRTIGADELDAQVSPRTLVASTIGDCIKGVSPSSKVFSVGVTPTSAVIAGGYLCDGAYWVSPRDGKMVSSTYYGSRLADWVEAFNAKELAKAYSTAKWSPSRDLKNYFNVLRSDIGSSKNKYSYSRLMATPAVNSLIKDFAVQTIIAENLGKDNSTDYLSVTFEGLLSAAAQYGSSSVECEDVFYRLDDEIATLIAFVETYVGKAQLLVVFSSANGVSPTVSEGSVMPTGYFNSEQFSILINGFLGAQLSSMLSSEQLTRIKDEDARWVLDYVEGQLYLNRRKIYAAGLSLSEVQSMAAQFAIQFRGVASAVTSSTLMGGEFSRGVMGMAHRSYFARHSGDVTLCLLPGWIASEGYKSDSGSPYIYDTHIPLIFWGGEVKQQRVIGEVSLEDIAPTIAKILEITTPNSTTGRSIIN